MLVLDVTVRRRLQVLEGTLQITVSGFDLSGCFTNTAGQLLRSCSPVSSGAVAKQRGDPSPVLDPMGEQHANFAHTS